MATIVCGITGFLGVCLWLGVQKFRRLGLFLIGFGLTFAFFLAQKGSFEALQQSLYTGQYGEVAGELILLFGLACLMGLLLAFLTPLLVGLYFFIALFRIPGCNLSQLWDAMVFYVFAGILCLFWLSLLRKSRRQPTGNPVKDLRFTRFNDALLGAWMIVGSVLTLFDPKNPVIFPGAGSANTILSTHREFLPIILVVWLVLTSIGWYVQERYVRRWWEQQQAELQAEAERESVMPLEESGS